MRRDGSIHAVLRQHRSSSPMLAFDDSSSNSIRVIPRLTTASTLRDLTTAAHRRASCIRAWQKTSSFRSQLSPSATQHNPCLLHPDTRTPPLDSRLRHSSLSYICISSYHLLIVALPPLYCSRASCSQLNQALLIQTAFACLCWPNEQRPRKPCTKTYFNSFQGPEISFRNG